MHEQIQNLIHRGREKLARLQGVEFPQGTFIYWHPVQDKYAVAVHSSDRLKKEALCKGLLKTCGVSAAFDGTAREENGWMPLVWPKGYSPLRKIAGSKTTPLSLSLAGALLGGTGGGLWSLYNTRNHDALPYDIPWKDRFRLALKPALIGAGLGTIPGLTVGLAHSLQTRHKNTDGTHTPAEVGFWRAMLLNEDQLTGASSEYTARRYAEAAKRDAFGKQSSFGPLDTSSPMIAVDNFNRTIWDDTKNGFIQPENALLVSSTLSAARPAGSTFVTPGAVGKTLVNAGIGWVTAGILGKTLGAMGGLSEQSQAKLRELGVWGGMINSVGSAMVQ